MSLEIHRHNTFFFVETTFSFLQCSDDRHVQNSIIPPVEVHLTLKLLVSLDITSIVAVTDTYFIDMCVCTDIMWTMYMRISENHNSLGCEQPSRPRC